MGLGDRPAESWAVNPGEARLPHPLFGLTLLGLEARPASRRGDGLTGQLDLPNQMFVWEDATAPSGKQHG